MKKTYFKGLNELRAIAALLVIFYHVEYNKSVAKISNVFDFHAFKYFISHLGHNAVGLFFIISGFLITTLLLDEKIETKSIDLKYFYFKRFLRIWPLYFLILFIAFFIIPHLTKGVSYFMYDDFHYKNIVNPKNYDTKSRLLHFLFLTNLGLFWYCKHVVAAAQTWSLSIEEQFYLFWPLLIKFLKDKIVIFILILLVFFYTSLFYINDNSLLILKYTFNYRSVFIGAIGAYLYKFEKVYLNKILQYKLSLIVCLATILILTFIDFDAKIQDLLVSVFFLFLVITKNNLIFFRSKLFSGLGMISYGIYMFHPLVMYFVFPFANKYLLNNLIVYNIVVYILVFSLTIILSHFSYKYFESYFLRIKEKKFNSQ